MKPFSIDDIRDWNPCYDPSKHLPEDWAGTALDILRMKNIPAPDRLWVALRDECLTPRELRLFAVGCARRALKKIATPRA